MKHDYLQEEKKDKRNHLLKKGWQKVVACLAVLVAVCTVYTLMLPAVTMEEEDAEFIQTQIDHVITRIEALPGMEEVEQTLTAYEEAGDEVGYEAYYLGISTEAKTVYAYYEDLGPDLQSQVTNREKLMELEWIWQGTTLAITDTLTVYQVNSYSQVATTVVHGGSVREKLGSGMSYTYWDAIVVEKDSSGNLYVAQYVTADGDKRDYRATTSDGFIILLYNTSVNVETGQIVLVDFDYKTVASYQSAGCGNVTFDAGTPEEGQKPDKDNSGKLTIVPGADTRELIEVNLYDYGNNINELYNKNSKYPGFQQEGGSQDVGDSFNKWQSFNFGNNITSDLAAGKANITVAGGTGINATANGANSPISGAMKATLGTDGQPALADGTSLGYLFSSSAYATKKNSQSLNGLFQYHEDTGAYTFNSRENHAQFNAGSDTFTLYEQLLTSNFMMYPFGNFLPFNDIVHLSAQTSTIDRAYLETMANSAQYKYHNGAGDAYGTLATQLKKFLTLMDQAYPNGWTGVDCMNEYFKSAGIPRTFQQGETLLQNLYSIDYDEPTDFYFGMEMKMNFMQPKEGLTGKDGKQPMVFYFTGDDDVWVYMDGRLFLDLSGIHRHVGGEIDFVNGVVNYYDLDVSTGDVSQTPSKTVPFSEIVSSGLNEKGTFTDYSTHSFNFYYMERGSGSGVCRMNFNFPLLRKNSISVTKELSVDEEGKGDLLGNMDFRFQVLKENGEELFIGEGKPYRILDASGNEIGTGTTDEHGVFCIKAGQSAVFSDINENAGTYFVRELLEPDVFEQYGNIMVDGSTLTKNYDVTVGSDHFKGVNSPVKDMADGSTAFRFDNQVTFHKLGSLEVTKKLVAYSDTQSEKSFQFLVTLDGQLLPAGTYYQVGEETRNVQEEGIIELSPEETAVIGNILAGTEYKVEEAEGSTKGYCVTYKVDGNLVDASYASGRIQTDTSVEVEVTNSEKGTTIEIPVRKTLEKPDGKEHHYKMQLQQVNSETDLTPVSPAFSQECEIQISDAPVDGMFRINYLEREMDETSRTYYYKIVELENSEEKNTIFDTAVYVVAVTVTKNQDGNLLAERTSVWKDGVEMEALQEEKISFVNQIEWYELPDTGGTGNYPYTMGGLLLCLSTAVFLMYRLKPSGKGEEESF